MKKNILLVSASVALLAFAVTACSSTSSETTTAAVETTVAASEETTSSEASEASSSEGASSESAELPVFTAEELAKYNGKDGAEAYVAVDGIVYDVTGVEAWANGGHQGFEAGQDLTEAIKKAPHGTSTLKGLKQVGTYEK